MFVYIFSPLFFSSIPHPFNLSSNIFSSLINLLFLFLYPREGFLLRNYFFALNFCIQDLFLIV
ncbi:unnamed protein product [Meloidogyne enterolobii]|uniref:Uncharacterized protein n=1 Tax=Meloidogyne enterolobii TaxID=390850 RepID=A0ACB1AIJ6_MELEN